MADISSSNYGAADYSSIVSETEAARTLDVLDSATSADEAIARLSGREIKALAPGDSISGISTSKQKMAAKRINNAMQQLRTGLTNISYSQLSPQQKSVLQRLSVKLDTQDSPMTQAVAHAALKIKPSKSKEGLLKVTSDSRRILRGHQESLTKATNNTLDVIGTQLEASAPGMASKKEEWQGALLASQDGRVPFKTRAKVTPKVLGGGVSGAYQMKRVKIEGNSATAVSENVRTSNPDNLATEPLAVVKPAKQELGGDNTVKGANAAQNTLETYGQKAGWGPVNERTAFFIQEDLGVPLGVPETEACLLPHSSFGEPDADLAALQINYGVEISQEDLLEIAGNLRSPGGDNFVKSAERLVYDKVAQQLASAHFGAESTHMINGATVKLCLDKSANPEQFVDELAKTVEVSKNTLDAVILGTPLGGGNRLPSGVPKVLQFVNDQSMSAKVNAQTTGRPTQLESHLRGSYAKLTHSRPAAPAEWSSMQSWVDGGKLFLDLTTNEIDQIPPLAFMRLAILDGVTGNQDRGANNIMTVVKTQDQLIESMNKRLPGIGQHVQDRLAEMDLQEDFDPETLKEMSDVEKQRFIQDKTEKILQQWDVVHPNEAIDASRLDMEWDVQNMVHIKVSGTDSFRDLIAIDNAMGCPDPEVGHWIDYPLPNNHWVGEAGARLATIPTRTSKHLASLDVEQHMLNIRGEHQRLQDAAGTENTSLTEVSEARYQYLQLGLESIKVAAQQKRTAFEMGVFKDSVLLKGSDEDISSIEAGGKAQQLYRTLTQEPGAGEDAVVNQIEQGYQSIADAVGAEENFNKLAADQRRLTTHD